MCETIRIFGLESESIVDGPGIRFSIFVQGCPRACEGCHNPDSLDFGGGYDMSCTEIFAKIKKNPLVKGITLSGGEPFCQAGKLLPLARMIKEGNYELAIYTGYLFEELAADKTADEYELLKLADILIDGPFEKSKRDISLRFRGSSNQRIIDVKKSILEDRAICDKSERWNG